MKSSSLDAKSGLYSGTQPKNKTKEKTKKQKQNWQSLQWEYGQRIKQCANRSEQGNIKLTVSHVVDSFIGWEWTRNYGIK